MIREFWVENFLSIKERQTLNFETRLKEDEWASVDMGGEKRVNKLAVIYGANASGKSNMLVAIQTVFEILFYHRTNRQNPVVSRRPFALNQEVPTRMFVSFYANHKRYDYDVLYTKDHIIDELLEWYPNGSKSLFYERHYVSQEAQASIKFGTSLNISSKTKDAFLQNTLNNHSVLACFGKNSFSEDAKQLADLYYWIASYMHEINSQKGLLEKRMKSIETKEKAKRFYLQLLQKADINIVDFYTETITEKIQRPDFLVFDNDSHASEDGVIQLERVKVYFVCQAGKDKFTLSYDEQSAGTKKFLSNLSALYSAITDNHVFLIDEIDSELHDDLLLYFLNVFLMNTKESQLIFTSQETSLLSEDLLNAHRDFVFFAEKNREGAYSEYTRADEYGLHKNLSLYKSYRNGRLGAIPQLGSPILYLEDEED
ncbi:MAG: ATP-binding protein [Bacteroidales bacterium]|nr:ATP-binding protein [Bacteroidales bacterium]